jgi:hypothetical protein
LVTFPAAFPTLPAVFQYSNFPPKLSDGLETAANAHGLFRRLPVRRKHASSYIFSLLFFPADINRRKKSKTAANLFFCSNMSDSFLAAFYRRKW